MEKITMITLSEKAHPKQNIGLIDRLLRLFIGAALIGAAYYYSAYVDLVARIWDVWGSFSMMIALYPIFTGMLGWDPFYALFHVRSCSITGRNQCGTLPYQVKAMFGHAPKYTESETEHSLESCHDEPVEHPHHKVWRVDEDPILYPDDKAWHSYFLRLKFKKRVSPGVSPK
jgi:hypothetical protein